MFIVFGFFYGFSLLIVIVEAYYTFSTINLH